MVVQFLYFHFIGIYILTHQMIYPHFSIFIFIVELNQDFSMTVRLTPTSKHLVFQLRNTLHQHFIASNKLFKQFIGFLSSKVILVGVAPHGFLTAVILDIFVQARSNIFMIILLNPFLECVESILLSLFLAYTAEYWWSHDVAGRSV